MIEPQISRGGGNLVRVVGTLARCHFGWTLLPVTTSCVGCTLAGLLRRDTTLTPRDISLEVRFELPLDRHRLFGVPPRKLVPQVCAGADATRARRDYKVDTDVSGSLVYL